MPDQPPPARDLPHYCAAIVCGALAGWLDVQVGDSLFTALLVLAPAMVLGFLRPRRPWRWAIVLCACVPITRWVAFMLVTVKSYECQIYSSFLVILPGLVGAYGGAFGRGVVDHLFAGK